MQTRCSNSSGVRNYIQRGKTTNTDLPTEKLEIGPTQRRNSSEKSVCSRYRTSVISTDNMEMNCFRGCVRGPTCSGKKCILSSNSVLIILSSQCYLPPYLLLLTILTAVPTAAQVCCSKSCVYTFTFKFVGSLHLYCHFLDKSILDFRLSLYQLLWNYFTFLFVRLALLVYCNLNYLWTKIWKCGPGTLEFPEIMLIDMYSFVGESICTVLKCINFGIVFGD